MKTSLISRMMSRMAAVVAAAAITSVSTVGALEIGDASEGASGGYEEFKPLKTTAVAFLMADDPSDDELAAKETFIQCFPEAADHVIKASEFSKEWADAKYVKAIWIHILRSDVEEGWQNLPASFSDEDFVTKLKDYSWHGGKMYLSGLATQLLNAIGRNPDNWVPNVGGFPTTATATLQSGDSWGVRGDFQDIDHQDKLASAMHAIYGQTAFDHPGYFATLPLYYEDNVEHLEDLGDVPTAWPIVGPKDGNSLTVTDFNCMWQYNVNDFCTNNNAYVLGSWANPEVADVMGIVEFLGDNGAIEDQTLINNAAKFGTDEDPWTGITIANGMACFQYANKAENKYYDNLRNFTFNTLNYMTSDYIDNPLSGVETVEEEVGDMPAVYYDLQGIRVENPSNGIFVKVQGAKASKVKID